MTDLIQIAAPGALTHPAQGVTAETALGLWLSGFRSENTRVAYRKEMMGFAAYTGKGDLGAAFTWFLALEKGPAHAQMAAWRQEKIKRGLSPSSINRSLYALKSFVDAANEFGATSLMLRIKSEPSQSYRDTKGPGVGAVSKLIKAASEYNTTRADGTKDGRKDSRKAARDVAILTLAFYLGLRRGEIASLDVGHIDLEGGTVSVLGKGRAERSPITAPPKVCEAIRAWLYIRGAALPGDPLFVDLSQHSKGGRITGSSIYFIVRQHGKPLGIKTRPHGLRHAAITAALDAFDGNSRKVQSFSRHRDANTIRRYDDNRQDFGGQVAAALCAIVE